MRCQYHVKKVRNLPFCPATKDLSICNNGHTWNAQEVAEQRTKAIDEVEGKVEKNLYE